MVVFKKFCRQFVDPKTKVPKMSSEFSKNYFHFNGTCIRRYNSCLMPQLVEVAENLKSLFSDMHKTFLHALGICLQFDVLVCSWDELVSIRDYYREGRLCRSLAQFFKLCYAHFGVKLSYAAQLIWFIPHIFHLIFSKLIKSSVP